MSGDQAKPYPKATQLARGERRYRRKIASPKQWQAIQAGKLGRCRCEEAAIACEGTMQLHHLVPRDRFGDDVADNLVPLCQHHHRLVEGRYQKHVRALLSNLTDAEYAYAVSKAGEDVWERVYGIRYSR